MHVSCVMDQAELSQSQATTKPAAGPSQPSQGDADPV